jgi:hypothetical protein
MSETKKRVVENKGFVYHHHLIPLSWPEWESFRRTTDLNGISGLFGMQPPGYFASWITFNPKFNIAILVETKERCVGSFDLNVVVFDKY